METEENWKKETGKGGYIKSRNVKKKNEKKKKCSKIRQ